MITWPIGGLVAAIVLAGQSAGGLDMREMAAASGEAYSHCLAYNAIKFDDGKSAPRDLVLIAKAKCSVDWSMYKFFVKQSEAARGKTDDTVLEAALGALDEIAIDNATNFVAPVINSVRREGQ